MLTISPLASITVAWFIWHRLNTVSTIHRVGLRPRFLWFGRAPSSSHAFSVVNSYPRSGNHFWECLHLFEWAGIKIMFGLAAKGFRMLNIQWILTSVSLLVGWNVHVTFWMEERHTLSFCVSDTNILGIWWRTRMRSYVKAKQLYFTVLFLSVLIHNHEFQNFQHEAENYD